ncbi:MAG: orotidine-5'-phosphate decarboxylase [Planctomycetota bacterium]
MDAYADRLDAAMTQKASPLCVGLDPRLDKLPKDVTAAAGGDAGKALLRWSLEILDLVAPHAACVKPNIAFYEAYGVAGLSAYSGVVRGARTRGLLVIGDVKRGDLSTTAEAYAAGHLAPGGDFEVDAITVAPYLGADSLAPFVGAAVAAGKGIYVLVRTSNPGAGDLQDLDVGGVPLYQRTAALVRAAGEAHRGRSGLSSVGAVVGATWPAQAKALRAALPDTPFLVPGYGAQGATAADVAVAFLPGGRGAVVNASRSVTFPTPKDPATPWRAAVEAAARTAKEELHAAARRIA